MFSVFAQETYMYLSYALGSSFVKGKYVHVVEVNDSCTSVVTLQTPSLYRLQGSPCVVILPCKDPVKITGYHSNPSSYVVGT